MSSALPQDNHLLYTSLSPENEDSEFQNRKGFLDMQYTQHIYIVCVNVKLQACKYIV